MFFRIGNSCTPMNKIFKTKTKKEKKKERKKSGSFFTVGRRYQTKENSITALAWSEEGGWQRQRMSGVSVGCRDGAGALALGFPAGGSSAVMRAHTGHQEVLGRACLCSGMLNTHSPYSDTPGIAVSQLPSLTIIPPCVWVHSQSSVVSNSFATLWTVVPPGSSVHGVFQARILEWVDVSSSRGSSQPRE